MRSLSELKDYELVNSKQDVRGFAVRNVKGQHVGRIRELLVDTQRERVARAVLDDGQQFPVEQLTLHDNWVEVDEIANTQEEEEEAIDEESPRQHEPRAKDVDLEKEAVLPIVEEQINVGKRAVPAGGVRVESRTIKEPVQREVDLRSEHISVERQPVDRPLGDKSAVVPTSPQGPIDVVAKAEQAIVEKEARVVEEVVVKKRAEDRAEVVRDQVRRTDVKVEPIRRR